MARPRLPRPTDAELQILAVLWRRDRATVREVYMDMRAVRGSGYNSVLKLMQIMHDKELVTRDDRVRPQRYSAVKTEQATQRQLIRDLVTRAFNGSGAALVMQTLNACEVSQMEREGIRAALESREKQASKRRAA